MFGQYAPDVASVGTNVTNYALNVVPAPNDGYAPLHGVEEFSDALASKCVGAFGAVNLDGSTTVFAGTSTKLYILDATARTWGDVTRASGGDYSVLNGELWDFAQFGNNVVATVDNNAIQYYTLGTSSKFANLTGSPPQAKRVSVVGDFLVLSGLTSYPNRIHWSAINDITGWTVGTNQSDYQEFPDGGTVQGIAGGEFGIVFQNRAIRRMIYTGPPGIFQFERISEDRGCLMRYSICKAAGMTFFLANDGFYKIDRGGGMTPIGVNRVDKTVLDELDTTLQANMVGRADPLTKRVFWFYKAITGDLNHLNKVIIYDWVLDRWSSADIDVYTAATVLPLTTTLESLDSVGDLDSLPYSLDSYSAGISASLAVVSANVSNASKFGFFTGAALEATIDTPEGMLPEGYRTFARSVAPIGDASGAYVSMLGRARLIDSKVQTSEATIGVRGYASLRQNNRFSTIRVRVPAGETWTFLRGADVTANKSAWR
jgi:hypothetical protein